MLLSWRAKSSASLPRWPYVNEIDDGVRHSEAELLAGAALTRGLAGSDGDSNRIMRPHAAQGGVLSSPRGGPRTWSATALTPLTGLSRNAAGVTIAILGKRGKFWPLAPVTRTSQA